MPKRTQTRWHRQRGQSTIELTMTLVIVFIAVFWIFELGWLMYTYSAMANAANEGVRYAIVQSGGDASGTQATVTKFAATSLHNISAISISVTFPDGTAAPPNRVRVTVSYPYIPWLPNLLPNPPTMQTYAEGRMVAQ